MKPYFTKYLPLDGEIKDGDLIRGDNGEIFPARWIPKNTTQKYKLFLCSRDIQIGDVFRSTRTNPTKDLISLQLPEPVENGAFPLYCYYTNDGEYIQWVPYNEGYKIIGEISPEAIWVKEEGMDFDEDEIYKAMWSPKFKTFGHSPGMEVRIKIKCPTCGSFH